MTTIELHLNDATRPHALVPAWSVLAALLLSVCASSAWAQPPAADPVEAFTAATRDYAQLHRRIEQQLGPIQITDRPETLRHAIDAMAAAIRAERRDARQGDLFTPALGRELRVRIDQALRAHGFTAADVLVDGAEGPDPADFTLRVNGPFPWVLSQAMFPCVTGALPPLPPELQYRIVGTDLVLVDVHASLIVDMLPDALTGLTLRNDRPDE